MVKWNIISGILFCIFVMNGPVSAEDWGWPDKKVQTVSAYEPLFERMINAYKRELSPVQGSRCPFHPSCSTYTLYCMKHYGFAAGFIMGMERIYLRENPGLFQKSSYYEKIYVKGVLKYYDHPEANTIFSPKNWHHYNAYFIAWPADSPVFTEHGF